MSGEVGVGVVLFNLLDLYVGSTCSGSLVSWHEAPRHQLATFFRPSASAGKLAVYEEQSPPYNSYISYAQGSRNSVN